MLFRSYAIVAEVEEELKAQEVQYKIPEQGIMIETPAAVMISRNRHRTAPSGMNRSDKGKDGQAVLPVRPLFPSDKGMCSLLIG